jgi:hypothetical protein
MYIHTYFHISTNIGYPSALHLRTNLQKNRINDKYQLGATYFFLRRVVRVNRVPRHPHTATPRESVSSCDSNRDDLSPAFIVFYAVL